MGFLEEFEEKFQKPVNEWTIDECLECIGDKGARAFKPDLYQRLKDLGIKISPDGRTLKW